MAETLNFDEIYYYDTLKSGITIPATLKNDDLLTKIDAKVDTGAAFCIFERRHGEHLGLDIEGGRPEVIGTATGTFSAFGHEITLSVLGIETISTVYFAKDDSFIRNVLGRMGWLDRIRLGLIDYEGKLFLSTYAK